MERKPRKKEPTAVATTQTGVRTTTTSATGKASSSTPDLDEEPLFFEGHIPKLERRLFARIKVHSLFSPILLALFFLFLDAGDQTDALAPMNKKLVRLGFQRAVGRIPQVLALIFARGYHSD